MEVFLILGIIISLSSIAFLIIEYSNYEYGFVLLLSVGLFLYWFLFVKVYF